MATPLSTVAAVSAAEASTRSSKRALEPIDRVSEVLFGLIMVLTFTGSLSVATAGRAEVRDMLVAALGCNLAWGIIDALLYLLGCLAEKGRNLAALLAVRGAGDAKEGQRVIADALPPLVASVLEPAQLEAVRQSLVRLPAPPARPRLTGEDWRGGLAVFLLVVASTLPVAIPFLIVSESQRALRLSNAVAIVMLFVCGYAVGRLTRYHPWATGVGMVLLGTALVALTMALGG
jgi:VIT1/CCC1 family predicted Fe2+/Mn2+ transporter